MKVCPKCGYVEVGPWRQNRWRTQVEFCPTSEFKLEKPALLQKLQEGHPFATDEHYAYRLSGKPKWIVERVWIELFKVGGKTAFHIPAERHEAHLKDPYQQKLNIIT